MPVGVMFFGLTEVGRPPVVGGAVLVTGIPNCVRGERVLRSSMPSSFLPGCLHKVTM